ncbi:MAG: hypothetical protein KJ971_02220 [Firmicutes bacterium]|nr:hypothetical protein [Bacillota bacterium]
MKKILTFFVLLIFLFSLIGCTEQTRTQITSVTTDGETTTTVSTTIGNTTTTTVSTTTQTTTEEWFYMTKDIEFINYSEEFVREDPIDTLTFYYYPYKEGIPFVDIEEFVRLLLGIIDENVQVEVLANQVSVYIESCDTEVESMDLCPVDDYWREYVTFDFDNTVVTAPSIDSFDYFTGNTETDFSLGLTLSSYEEEELPAFSADLSDYNFRFSILEIEGETFYTIPLSIANLFLTGSMFDVINNGDYLYGVDTYQIGDIRTSLTDPVRYNNDLTSDMRKESEKFLIFVFNTFYGLKDYKNISDFDDIINFTKTDSFEEQLWQFSLSLLDGHTAIISTGHTASYYNPGSLIEYTAYYNKFYKDYYGGCECDILPDEYFEVDFYEDLAYFRFNSFTENFRLDIEPYMNQIIAAAPSKIVIDLACNGGGVLAGVFQMLNYMTNDDLSFYTISDGARSSYTYEVEGDYAIDADFYIVTSSATYSAANYFTALAQELGLAKVIGARSGGGACSIKAIVLPNGAVMVMSSPMNLTYSTYETVELGVPLDQFYRLSNLTTYLTPEDFYGIIESMNTVG